MKVPRSVFFAAIAATATAVAEPKVWLDERFADGERSRQALPASAEWFTSSSPSTVSVIRGSLTQEGGGRHLLAYFTPANAPVELAVGEALVLTYEIALNTPLDGPGSLRVGLFDSGGDRIVTDKQARSDDFADYRGYMGAANPTPSKAPSLRIYERTLKDETLVSAITPFSPLGGGDGGLQALPDGKTCTGSLRIERDTAGKVTVTHGFSGDGLPAPHSVSATDDSDIVTRFDTVVFHAGTKAAHGFTLTSVHIETITN